MSTRKVFIEGWGSISGLGISPSSVWKNLSSHKPAISCSTLNGREALVSPLDREGDSLIAELARSTKNYSKLDRSALLAIFASQEAVKHAGWNDSMGVCGVSIGSARGATHAWESAFSRFTADDTSSISPYTSPTTTLGNIASWAAHAVGAKGVTLSHSMACSSGIQALANGVAWIKAGMVDRFLAGGSEAALTAFTVSQMRALRLYADPTGQDSFPCRPMGTTGKNTLILGEGAAVFALAAADDQNRAGARSIAEIESIGLSQEGISSFTSISSDGDGFQKSMRQALDSATGPVDVVVTHAPGTLQGDHAELTAIEQVFGINSLPYLNSNKWSIGHCFGASGALSLEFALLMLLKQEVIPVPYETQYRSQNAPGRIERIMVNSAGFGGNTASIIIRRAFG